MNYYEQCEELDNALFVEWAQQFFTKMERQPLMSRVDWLCESKSGKKFACELKLRNTLKYPDIFIEPQKYSYLMGLEGYIPLFINMCTENGVTEILVFDLRKCKIVDKGMVSIWSHPDKCYMMVHRYAINKKYAYRFINNCEQKKN